MYITEGEIQSLSSVVVVVILILMLKLIIDAPCGSIILLLTGKQKRFSFI
jgi:hypothetical protein